MAINQTLYDGAEEIRDASAVGENTALRVGTELVGIVEEIGDIDDDVNNLNSLTNGLQSIKDDWFEIDGQPVPYEIPSGLVGKQQTIGYSGSDTGKIWIGDTAAVSSCVPKAINPTNGNLYHPSSQECFAVDELPNGLLSIKFNQTSPPAQWLIAIAMFNENFNFISRSGYLKFNNENNWQNTFDFTQHSSAKYFVLVVYHQSTAGTSDNALNVTFQDGFAEFQIKTYAQESMPNRVADLEEQVGQLVDATFAKFRIASWNVGHFALGQSYKTSIDTQEEYEEMRGKWRMKLNEMSPDVLVMCEYSTVFADLATDVGAKDAIFNQFRYRAIGSHPSATSYMQTAQYSNIFIDSTYEVVYPHTDHAGRYYQVSDLYFGSVIAKLVITHLDFSNSTVTVNGVTMTKRESQMRTLISAFSNDSHVIICGDFNNSNANEFDLFANAGYKMANHGYMGDLLTYPAGAATKAIDNIIVKGFAVSNISIVDDATLTDHAAIMCDLTLIN